MDRILLLDVDGTLVDTNYHHAIAWFRAFRRHDVTVPLWRVHRSIGMGGDQLIGAVAGETVESRCGDGVRAAWKEEVDPLLREVQPAEGAHRLLVEANERGFTVVLASSGKPEHVDHYLDLLDARKYAKDWTTSGDVEATKPEPDLIQAALEKAGDGRAVVVGDSVWDCVAAERLGLPSVCVRTGGLAERELRDAGDKAVYESLDQLRVELDDLPMVPTTQPG